MPLSTPPRALPRRPPTCPTQAYYHPLSAGGGPAAGRAQAPGYRTRGGPGLCPPLSPVSFYAPRLMDFSWNWLKIKYEHLLHKEVFMSHLGNIKAQSSVIKSPALSVTSATSPKLRFTLLRTEKPPTSSLRMRGAAGPPGRCPMALLLILSLPLGCPECSAGGRRQAAS